MSRIRMVFATYATARSLGLRRWPALRRAVRYLLTGATGTFSREQDREQ